jgi:hypothetical protein
MAYIALNSDGMAWDGSSWGWKNTRRFMTVGSAIRSLQEAGEDIDSCSIIEDIFIYNDNRIPA